MLPSSLPVGTFVPCNCDVRLGGLLKPLVTVAVHIGARKGEPLGLKWDQVNFDQGIISLLDTKNGERKVNPPLVSPLTNESFRFCHSTHPLSLFSSE